MVQHELILVQSENSPYAGLLAQALSLSQAASAPRAGDVQELARLGREAPALVVWDVGGFEALERESLANLLSVSGVGVVLICPALDEAVQALLERVTPLALLVAPQGIHQVAACLEVAQATHRRLTALGLELDKLREEMADRLLVERAKRVLMESRGLSEAQAMANLQSYARRGNLKLPVVARRILSAYRVFNGLHEGEE